MDSLFLGHKRTDHEQLGGHVYTPGRGMSLSNDIGHVTQSGLVTANQGILKVSLGALVSLYGEATLSNHCKGEIWILGPHIIPIKIKDHHYKSPSP